MDMSNTIAPKSSQLNSDDLIAGPRTITIVRVSANEGNPDQPVAVSFDGDEGRPFLPCKTVRRIMVTAWGPDASTYVGRSMTLYRDPAVQFGGMQVGGIRVSHMSHIDRDLTMALTATRAKRAPVHIKRLVESKPAAVTPPPTTPRAVSAADFDAALVAAKRGVAAFREWWRAIDKPIRDGLQGDLTQLRQIAEEADAARDADPFGLPPLPDEGASEAAR